MKNQLYNYKFGTLTNNILCYAPKPLVYIEDGIKHYLYTDDAEVYLAHGYKQIIKEPYPEIDPDKEYVTEKYAETDTSIIVSYEIHEIPEEEV